MDEVYRSITVTGRGGLEAVRVVERDRRPPAAGEVRVRVLASAVCQDDVAIRVGNRPFLRNPPYVPGYSFIGVVEALGAGVTEVARGQRVAALTQFDSHAEVVYRAAGDLAPVPEDLDPVAASTLILNYLVAQQILHRVAHVHSGDSALIVGASGGVGTALLQLGEVAGLRMYGTASPAKHPILAAHGATPIDYRAQDVGHVVSTAEPGGLDYVFNGMGPQYIGLGMRLLAPGGLLVTYGAPQGFGDFLKLLALMMRHTLARDNRRIRGYGTHREGTESFKQDWATLFGGSARAGSRPSWSARSRCSRPQTPTRCWRADASSATSYWWAPTCSSSGTAAGPRPRRTPCGSSEACPWLTRHPRPPRATFGLMAVSEKMTVTVDAPVEQVLAFLRDIDHQQDWFPGNTESEVLERDEQGRPSKARLVNDVKVAKDEFVLDYTHSDSGFSWVLPEPTRVQKVQEGSWSLADKGGKTVATMSLTVETSLPLPGFVQRKTVKDTLKNATKAVVAHF